MYMERRTSIQLTIGLLAFALATILSFSLLRRLPPTSLLAPLALLLLYAAAIAGCGRLFRPPLAPALTPPFPRLDAEAC